MMALRKFLLDLRRDMVPLRFGVCSGDLRAAVAASACAATERMRPDVVFARARALAIWAALLGEPLCNGLVGCDVEFLGAGE